MVINILVHIESCKDIERVAEIYLSRNSGVTPEHWEKVRGTYHRVNMNDGHDPISVLVEIGLDNPHPAVRVGVVEGLGELMDERA